MKVVFFITTLFLGAIGLSSVFKNYTKLKKWEKILLFFLGLFCLVYSLFYQEVEKHIQSLNEQRKALSQEMRLDEINKGIDALAKKDKEGLLSNEDYLRYVSLNLESLNMNLSIIRRTFKKDFSLDYISDIEKIPAYLDLGEWKEIEQGIYQKTIQRIKGDFADRNISNGSERYLIELANIRTLIMRAKERVLSGNALKQ